MRFILVFSATLPLFANAANIESRLTALEAAVAQLQQQLSAKDATIAELRARLTHAEEAAEHGEHEQHHEHGPEEALEVHDEHDDRIAVSGVLNIALGGGDESAEVLEALQGGAHDPSKRGFNLQQFELAVRGEVGPFDTETYVIFREDEVELEEAFASTELGELDLKLGYFLTEFGRINPGHLETWDFLDQPVINTRLFGGEGTRGTGLRMRWRGFSLSAQNSDDQAPSFRGEPGGHGHGEEAAEEGLPEAFGEEGIGGRPFQEQEVRALEDFMYTARWVGELPVGELGVSAMWGRNGNAADTDTWIYGLDYRLDDRDGRWSWQSEIMKREYATDAFALSDDRGTADPSDDIAIDLAGDTLEDWGLYSQFLYDLNERWTLGLRAEYASGSVDSAEEGQLITRNDDPARANRTRLSPLVTYQPSERSRLRLQYNFDKADFLPGGRAHALWFGFELAFGDHPDHRH